MQITEIKVEDIDLVLPLYIIIQIDKVEHI